MRLNNIIHLDQVWGQLCIETRKNYIQNADLLVNILKVKLGKFDMGKKSTLN